MRKRALVCVFVFLIWGLLFLGFVAAQEDRSDQIDKAFSCLTDEVRKAPSLTLEEAVFAYLAGVTTDKVKETIEDERDDDDCWPKGACTLRDTALVSIAKGANNKDNSDMIEWLTDHTKVPDGLRWYLEITITDDSEEDKTSSCKIEYDEGSHVVTVNDDQTVEGNAGGCFTVSESGYWFRLSGSCVDKEFSVGCDKAFRTDLIYQEESGGTVFVSSNSGSSVAGGVHTQAISAKCFEQNGVCNYEGSLWATAALADEGEEVGDYVPYLLGLRGNNARYFPETLLVYITGSSRNSLIEEILAEMSQGHWDISGSPYTPYYDTSLAMIALKSIGMGTTNTETWLFDVAGQTDDGCWNSNNIADTGFVLYAMGWADRSGGGGSTGGLPTLPGNGEEICGDVGGSCNSNCSESEEEIDAICSDSEEVCCYDTTAGNYDPFGPNDCEDAGYYCGERLACITSGGDELTAYNCDLFTEACCSIEVQGLDTCASRGGEICQFDEECSATEVSAADGACCVEGCRKVSVATGGSENECASDLDCPSGQECSSGECVGSSGGSSWWVWVILLVVLIGLAVLGIIYRDKLRVYVYKMRGKAKTAKLLPRGPPMQGTLARRPVPRLNSPPRSGVPPQIKKPPVSGREPMNPKDREMEETLRKLRKMGG